MYSKQEKVYNHIVEELLINESNHTNKQYHTIVKLLLKPYGLMYSELEEINNRFTKRYIELYK